MTLPALGALTVAGHLPKVARRDRERDARAILAALCHGPTTIEEASSWCGLSNSVTHEALVRLHRRGEVVRVSTDANRADLWHCPGDFRTRAESLWSQVYHYVREEGPVSQSSIARRFSVRRRRKEGVKQLPIAAADCTGWEAIKVANRLAAAGHLDRYGTRYVLRGRTL